jgi:tRNA(fMet)-specific endonuclease VapC
LANVPGYLLDTNVLSEIIRKRPEVTVLAHLREAPQNALFTSSVSVMELHFGAVRTEGGQILWERIRNDVLARVKILPLDEEHAERAGDILADLESRGSPIGIEDVMIGATALVARLVVVTRKVKHLSRIRGLMVENWWEK